MSTEIKVYVRNSSSKGFRQGDVFSQILFNITLEKVIRSSSNYGQREMPLGETKF